MHRLLALILTATALAAGDTTRSIPVVLRHDLETASSGIATEPLPTIALSMGSLAAVVWLSGTDLAIRSAVSAAPPDRTLETLAQIGNTGGELWSGVAVSAGLLAGGAAFGSEHTVTSGRQLLEALAVAGAITTTLKYTIGRARPDRNQGDGNLLPFRWDDGQWSFPSGHATVAGTIAGIAWARSQCWLLRGAATALAVVTMGARVYSDRHWTSDVLAGGTIGFAVGYAFREFSAGERAWMLVPSPQGISLRAAW